MAYNVACYYVQNCLGVGTDTPIATLQVVSSQNEPFVVQTANANTWMNLVATGGGGNWSMGAASGNKWIVYQRCDLPVGQDAHRLTIVGSTGNVGIGTTSPFSDTRLDVRSKCALTANVGQPVFFGSNDATGPLGLAIQHICGNGVCRVDLTSTRYGVSGNDLSLNVDSGNPNSVGGLYIKYQGNVGIGTSSPDTRLHIRNCVAGGTNNYLLTLQNTCTVSDARAGIALLDNSNTAGSGGISGVAIQASNNGVDGTGNMLFQTLLNGTATERMRITSAGNVGIGTAAGLSNVKLQICDGNAAGTDDMVRLMQCLPGNHAFYRSERCGGATMIMGPTRNSGDGCIPSESAIIWTTGNNPIVIGTCGRQRMRFATDGNAVLGGTSANIVGFTGTVLTVNGGGNYQGYEVSTSNVTRMTMVSDGNNGYLSTRVAGMCLIFETGAASEKMRITSGGCIGVGITSPSYLLHVNGTFYAAGSSIDYKEGICDYDTNSCLFMCLKPKTYQYKDEWKHLGKELKSETQIGLIAEEVAEVMPELAVLVNEDDNKVVRNVDYEKLSIVLLSEVQKLHKEIDQLKNIYTKQQ
jgi:hypothetical protein